ncbi:MAG: hypothetical protein M3N16_07575, partial [Actinomycetota bacterium]|nr:hypothetical protein [Actinomycetota bacterium]
FSRRAARGAATKARPSGRRRVRGVRLTGQVLGVEQGAIRLRLRRRSGRGWKTMRVATLPLRSGGGFGRTFLGLPRGAYRAQALFDGSADAEASRSPLQRFRLRR